MHCRHHKPPTMNMKKEKKKGKKGEELVPN
jgi:hypothetical protein